MAKSCYSTVFDQHAGRVWDAIRDFGSYQWAGDEYEAVIEEGRAGDSVGSVRKVGDESPPIRQRLLAHSNPDRSYTYEFCAPCPFPLRNYTATIRVTPVTDGNRAFVEWWATFDCPADECDRWTAHFERGFAGWLRSLHKSLAS